ncbi:hypothetical protein N7475_001990 [Penicillium sp. IBT 31633x]|nr:hypothetical protein N7475_001990 [Penicillium sp. IBT 31633x]
MAQVGQGNRFAWTSYDHLYARLTQRARRYEILPKAEHRTFDIEHVPLFQYFHNGRQGILHPGDIEVPLNVIHGWADHLRFEDIPQEFFNVIMERMFPLPLPHKHTYLPSDHSLQPGDESFMHRSPLPSQSFYAVEYLHKIFKLEDTSPKIRSMVRRWIDSNLSVLHGLVGVLEKETLYHSYEDALISIQEAGGVAVSTRPDFICQMAAENTERMHFLIKYCHLSPAAYDRTGKSLLCAAIHANNEESMLALIDLIPAFILYHPMEVSTVPVREVTGPGPLGTNRVEELTGLEAEYHPVILSQLWAYHPLHWLVKQRNARVLQALVVKYYEGRVNFPPWFHGHQYRLRMCTFATTLTAEILFRVGIDIASSLFVVQELPLPAPGTHVLNMTSIQNLWEDYNDPQEPRPNPSLEQPVVLEMYITSSWHEATKHPKGRRIMQWLAMRSQLDMYVTNHRDHSLLHHAALGNEVSCLSWLCQNMDVLHTFREEHPRGGPDRVFNTIVLAAFSRAWNSVKVFDIIVSHSPEDYSHDFELAKSVFQAIMYGMDRWMQEDPQVYMGIEAQPIPRTGVRLPTPRQLACQKCQAFVARLPPEWDGSREQRELIEEAKSYGFDFLQHSMRTPRAATRSMTLVEDLAEMRAEIESELNAEWEYQSNHPVTGWEAKIAKDTQLKGQKINTPHMREVIRKQAQIQKDWDKTKELVNAREEPRGWGGRWTTIKETFRAWTGIG